jgi:hypothetical protein
MIKEKTPTKIRDGFRRESVKQAFFKTSPFKRAL